MPDQRQTRCPHCGSLFRVSPAQLQAKNGVVRCGSCLEMFRADLNMVGETATERTPPPAAAATPATPPVSGAGKRASRDETWAEQLLQDDEASMHEATTLHIGAKVKPIDDHQTFGAMKAEDWSRSPSSNNTRISLGASELSDFMLENTSLEHNNPFHDASQQPVASTSDNADEAWAQTMLQQLADAEKKKAQPEQMQVLNESPARRATPPAAPAAAPTPSPPTAAAAAAAAATSFTFGDEQALDFLNDEDLSLAEGKATTAAGSVAQDAAALPQWHDPVAILSPTHHWPWERYLLWGGLQLLALLALCTQFAYFHEDALADQPALQGPLSAFCTRWHCRHIAGNLRGLRIDHLVLRPDLSRGILLIDTLLHNDQDQDRPYPTLRLTLRDSDGNILGTRKITPSDYLLASNLDTTLHAHTPVHVSLEVGLPADKIPAETSLTLQAGDQAAQP